MLKWLALAAGSFYCLVGHEKIDWSTTGGSFSGTACGQQIALCCPNTFINKINKLKKKVFVKKKTDKEVQGSNETNRQVGLLGASYARRHDEEVSKCLA